MLTLPDSESNTVSYLVLIDGIVLLDPKSNLKLLSIKLFQAYIYCSLSAFLESLLHKSYARCFK